MVGADEKSGSRAPFAGSAAIVMGGGSGIGRAVAQEFARRGARVAVADINAAGAEETAVLVRDAGGEAWAFTCDVSSEESIRQAGDAAEARFGPMDIVVNNAGILSGGNPEDIPLSAWQRMMDVNFFGVVRGVEHFLPGMIARGSGHIVNTASFAGLFPYAASRIHYAASKAAVISLSENLALYLMPKGVKVHCLCPGPVMTNVANGAQQYSTNMEMRGPGAALALLTAEQAATVLADGMRDGRIIIPTHEEAWDFIARHGAAPDQFIRDKAAEFEAGNSGLPGRTGGTR